MKIYSRPVEWVCHMQYDVIYSTCNYAYERRCLGMSMFNLCTTAKYTKSRIYLQRASIPK